MIGMTVGEIAAIVGGTLSGAAGGTVTGVTKDSRDDCAGCLYAAIPGARADGHDFIAMAFDKGAVCALANRVPAGELRPVIVVNDVEAALRALAGAYRRRLTIPVIGIAGSVGKTTTKEMVASVLAQRYRVHKTEKNFNNDLGVPLTLLRIGAADQVSVVEMGISDFGEMTGLAEMVRPTMAVYTVIGHAHLERLRDRPGVFAAKTEMLAYLPDSGTVFANGDDDLLAALRCRQKLILYGRGGNSAVRAENIRAEGLLGTSFDIVCARRQIPVRIPAYGGHMVYAALAGAAVGLELGLTDGEIAAGIAAYAPVGRRASVTDTGFVTLIDDCYNANPDSVRAAIDSMAAFPGRKVCILGDMLELGEDSPALHRAVGSCAARMGAALVLTAGERARDIGAAAREGGAQAEAYDTVDALLADLPGLLRQGDAVLVKASHSMEFDRVADAVKALKI